MASRAGQTSCSSPPPSENTGRRWRLGEGQGEVALGDIMATGDGAGFTAERAVSLTAREETKILLLDLEAG